MIHEAHSPLPSLYISSVSTAEDADALKRLGITHILTAARAIPPCFTGRFNYMLLELSDWTGEDILYYFDQAIKFIDEGRKNGKVLVHCMAGVSRSATIVAAYIMHTQKVPYRVAFNMLKKVRPCVCPNDSFKRQLEVYERWVLGVKLPPTYYHSLQPPPLENSEKTVESWPAPLCETLYKLEYLVRKSEIRFSHRQGVDPTLMLRSKVYDRFQFSFMRSDPTYLPVVDIYEKIRSNSEDFQDSEVDGPIITNGETSTNCCDDFDDDDEDCSISTEEMTRLARGTLHIFNLNEDEDEELDEYDQLNLIQNGPLFSPFNNTTDEFRSDVFSSHYETYKNFTTEKKPKKMDIEPVTHFVPVWTCKYCSRYLFTPLNVKYLGNDYIEIEDMDWMPVYTSQMQISKKPGKISCPRCKKDVGEYNIGILVFEGEGDIEPLSTFKIFTKDLNKIDLEIRL